MALVSYSDSEDDTAKKTESLSPEHKGKKRKLSGNSDLPPLPPSFHDLYASAARASTQDDPALHAGRQRQIPHIEGNWPTHVYIEWHPTNTESDVLSQLLSRVEKTLAPSIRLRSSLKSELGSELPLHISLSRSLMLATHQRQPFADALERTIDAAGLKPFQVLAEGYHWAPNYEKNRWFLVVKLKRPSNNDLNRLLRACNSVAEAFGQPLLYEESPLASDRAFYTRRQRHSVQANPKARGPVAQPTVYQDFSANFHISVGWTLEPPPLASLERLGKIVEVESLDIPIHTVKVKLGNSVIAIDLATPNVETNGIIGI